MTTARPDDDAPTGEPGGGPTGELGGGPAGELGGGPAGELGGGPAGAPAGGPTAGEPGSGEPGSVGAFSGGAEPSTLWLALGTLTALPVPPPSRVDRGVAGRAMAIAPVAGVVLAVPAVLLVAIGGWLGVGSLLPAVLAIGVLALATRGLHLDGLADTADGLAASYDRERALAVMRRGDTGPAGTATVVLTLLVQVAALSAAIDAGLGVLAIAVAVLAGRAVISMACARGVPSARPQGLGATVAGTVAIPVVALVAVVVAAVSAGLGSVLSGPWWLGPLAVVAGYLTAAVILRRCVRRFGGVTGDVLGACVEAATAAALITMAAA